MDMTTDKRSDPRGTPVLKQMSRDRVGGSCHGRDVLYESFVNNLLVYLLTLLY